MRRARKRNTYTTFVVSDLEACSLKVSKIMKIHVVSGVPQTLICWECLTRFLYFCILKSACFRRRWLVTKNIGGHENAIRIPLSCPRRSPGSRTLLKTQYFFDVFGPRTCEGRRHWRQIVWKGCKFSRCLTPSWRRLDAEPLACSCFHTLGHFVWHGHNFRGVDF